MPGHDESVTTGAAGVGRWGIGQCRGERVAQGGDVPRRNEPARVAGAHHLGDTPDVGRHDRPGAGESFEDGYRLAFLVRGEGDDVARGVPVRHLGRRQPAQQSEPRLAACLQGVALGSTADEDELGIEVRDCVGEVPQALHGVQPPH